MVHPDNEKRLTNTTDIEPNSRAVVEFCGYTHDQLNLEEVPIVLTSFVEHLTKYRERTTLFFEGAVTTEAQARTSEALVNRYGFRASLIGSRIERVTTHNPTINRERAENKVNEIEASLQSGSVDPRLLPLDILQSYLLFRGFDQLRDQVPFSYQVESHSPVVIERVEQLLAKSDKNINLADAAWQEGRYIDFQRLAQSVYQLRDRANRKRDVEIAKSLRGKVNASLRSEGGGSFFIVMGSSHVSLLDILARQINSDQVSFVVTGAKAVNMSPVKRFVVSLIGVELKQLQKESGNLATYGNRYQTIDDQLKQIIESLTEDEVTSLCESKVNLVEFVRGRGLEV